ncbi:MAG TPA: hypothetical protein VK926_04055 [Gaiellaceae bacterium]|nr:hypothetical protein [Gaiellaceae bacterium]
MLGVIVGVGRRGDRPSALVVRGGISEALVYIVPWERVRSVSVADRHVLLDADLTDFAPRLRDDGTIELRPVPD